MRNIFDRLFYSAQKDITKKAPPQRSGSIWHDLDRQEIIVSRAGARVGFADPHKAYENLLEVRDGEVYAPPSPKRLKVMRSLGPALITEIAKSSAPDQALLNLSKFSHRSAGAPDFSLFWRRIRKPCVCSITLFAESQFLTDLFLNRPEMIDTLIRVDLTRVEKHKR